MTRPAIRKRRKHNLPDPIKSGTLKEIDHARVQAAAQLESVKDLALAWLREANKDNEPAMEEAEQAIREDALSAEVRSCWTNVGQKFEPDEYRLVLCTGGPHVEIRGKLDKWSQPVTADILYQDWFTEFKTYHTDPIEQRYLLAYAQRFYFGE